jgi:dihydroxyacetone kinase-like predicted kinase
LEEIIEKANNVLRRTPEMLQCLRMPSCRCSGKDVIYIFEGMYQYLEDG